MMANRTRGARGSLNPNRTLDETPRHRLADSVLRKLFSEEKDFAKPRLISRPQKWVWRMNVGGFFLFGFLCSGSIKTKPKVIRCY